MLPLSSAHRAAAGLLALVAVTMGASCGRGEPPAEPLQGIVLIGVDTLRADGLGSYGNPRPTSPHLDALAARGVLFENAVSNASWTLPGFITLLSGEHPTARVYRGKLKRSGVERLQQAGFRTAGFSEGAYVSRQFGMDLGFDTFWEETAPVILAPGPEVGVAKTFAKAEAWLRENSSERFFLFVHTYEPHVPYQRLGFGEGLDPGVFGGVFDRKQNDLALKRRVEVGEVEREWVRALYDGGVLEADRAVGGLLAVLEELGVSDRTLVVVTSDHGEQLGEHRPEDLGLHGQTLWDTILHVPLIVHDPRRGEVGRRVATQVRAVDVMPTILELAGLAPEVPTEPASESNAPREPMVLDGRSLVPILDGAEDDDRLAFSELRDGKDGRLKAATLRTRTHKVHLNAPGTNRPALQFFTLEDDSGEQHDQAHESIRERARLHGELQKQVAEVERRGPPWGRNKSVPANLRRRLESLGYLGEE